MEREFGKMKHRVKKTMSLYSLTGVIKESEVLKVKLTKKLNLNGFDFLFL